MNRSAGQKLISVNVPNYSQPITLRPTVSDRSIFWQCIVMQQYDIAHMPQSARLMDQYKSIVSAGQRPVIVDCGANIGLASLWFARVFPEAIICSIEPDRDNFAMLKRNLDHLGDKARLFHGGVWNLTTTLRIKNPDAGSAAFMLEPCAPTEPSAIQAYTIADVCRAAGSDAPFIVKIDIEGAQSQLFESGTEWVDRTALIAIELDDWRLPWQGTSRSFFRRVGDTPFDYVLSGETLFCIRDLRAAADP